MTFSLLLELYRIGNFSDHYSENVIINQGKFLSFPTKIKKNNFSPTFNYVVLEAWSDKYTFVYEAGDEFTWPSLKAWATLRPLIQGEALIKG